MNNKKLIQAIENRELRMVLKDLPKNEQPEEINVIELLLANQFTYSGRCNCSGTTNYKYSKDTYTVYFLPKRKQFHLKLVNNYIVKNQSVNKLCSQLKGLGLTTSEYSSAISL